MNKEEIIDFLERNGIVPDPRCSIEDLQALISDEGLLIDED